jgi:UDP:flavonoid glycosyltransferase YjiC (YdhE family)
VGVPVIAVAGNMHQIWNAEAIVRAGAGELVRAGDLDSETLSASVRRVLTRASYSQAAMALAHTLSQYDPARRLEEILGRVLSHSCAVA